MGPPAREPGLQTLCRRARVVGGDGGIGGDREAADKFQDEAVADQVAGADRSATQVPLDCDDTHASMNAIVCAPSSTRG